MYLFISCLYMFRASQRSSSGGSNCINTSSDMISLCKVTAWFAGQEGTVVPSWPAYKAY